MGHQLDALGRLPREYRQRVHPFHEFTDRKFRLRYRITKESADDIVEHMSWNVPIQGQARGGGITLHDRFCLGVRYIATGSNFSVVGDYQGVSKATVSRSLDVVVNYFVRNSRRYIKWPITNAQKMHTAADFQAWCGRPRCLGLIDGTHIPILAPRLNTQAYINRHGYCSLNTMIVCDAKEQITHIDPSWSGSVGDGHAFNLSPLRQAANNGTLNPYYLLGDSAYPCVANLFPPVRIEANQRDTAFNVWHRTHRSKVERCIGMLKARFRALNGHGGFLYHTPQKSNNIIIAAACLHNVAEAEAHDFELDDDEDGANVHQPFAGNVPQPVPNGQDNNPAARTAFINAHF